MADEAIGEVKELIPGISNYGAVHHLINHESFDLNEEVQEKIENIEKNISSTIPRYRQKIFSCAIKDPQHHAEGG